MDTFGQSLQIAANLLTNPVYWGVLILTVIITGPLGMIPGVGSTTIIALALPFLVLNVDPVIGLIFVAGLLALGNTMDIIPAVLLGYPSVSTAVDFLEGHQLARRGLGVRVLGASYAVSLIGGLLGAVVMAFTMPLLRPFMVNFSYAEIAALALFGISMVAVLARGSVLRSLGAALLGLLLATIGTATLTAIDRFTFGQLYLTDGLPLIPAILGVFALPELIDLAMNKAPVARPTEISHREVWIGFGEGLKRWRTIPRQSLFGVFLGAVPGIGSAAVEWLSYGLGIAFAKDKSQFGKGSLDGILFTESAQSAKEAGQAIPTLAFGIPGGAGWALCLAAMIAYGISPGLGMLGQHLDITMGIVLTIGIGNLLGTILALGLTRYVANLTLVPYPFVAGMILPLMFLSAFQARFQLADILVLLGMGFLGLAMKWFGWPRPPLILGFVLGPTVEVNLWTALGIGGPLVFITRPYALTILVLAILSAVYLVWVMNRVEKRATVAAAESDAESDALAPALEDVAMDSRDSVPGREPVAHPPAPGSALGARGWRWVWRWEHVFWLALAAWIGGVVFRESLRFTGSTQFFPLWASAAFLVIMAVLIYTDLTRQATGRGDIMDLGMRTGTDMAAFRALLGMLAWIAAFIVMMGTLGFEIAAVVFPGIYIMANMRWTGRKLLWLLVPIGMSAFVTFGVMDYALNVIWPEPFILRGVQSWLGAPTPSA